MTESLTPGQRMYAAIKTGDASEVKRIITSDPSELAEYPGVAPTWLHYAARRGRKNIVEMLISAGIDVNKCVRIGGDSPLNYAVRYGQVSTAEHLISLGATPGVSRMLIDAINSDENSFELVKLLVEHGADVNQSWRFGDEEHGPLFNALSWAINSGRQDIADYLRAHGAVMPPEEPIMPASNASDAIIQYFTASFGPVDRKALQEIVPSSDCPVVIHRISPTESRNSNILFTTGMSEQPMHVPESGEDYRFAELLIELPADWPLSKDMLTDADNRWPIDWIRKVAAYPRLEQTWLGGPFAIMANSDPPTEFSPQCKFSSMLLAAGYDGVGPIELANGYKVQVYTLVPLYENERKLEQTQGLPELFRRLDQFEVGRLVIRGRPSVASANAAAK